MPLAGARRGRGSQQVTTTNTADEAIAIARAQARRGPAWLRARLSLVLKVVSICAFLGLWSAATELGWISPIFLPSPAAVARAAGKLMSTGELWDAVLASSRRGFPGFSVAAVVAGAPRRHPGGLWAAEGP